jgi:glucuronoarabinoxylan endo-1,4-beta-xylanase
MTRARILVLGTVLAGCNAILGISNEYHYEPEDGAGASGRGGSNHGGTGNATSAGGAGATAGHGATPGSGGVGVAQSSAGGEAGEAGVGPSGNGGVSDVGTGGTGVIGGAGGARGGRGGTGATGGDSGAPAGGEGGVSATGGGGGTPAQGGTSGASSGGSSTGGRGGGAGSGGSATSGSANGGSAGSTGGRPGPGGSGGIGGGAGGGGAASVQVSLNQPRQQMDGFGISDIDAPVLTDTAADQLFDQNLGIGLSILRIGVDTTGGPLSSSVWTDVSKAQTRGVGTFIASVRSAPGNCKNPNSVNDGGHLLSGCYDSWASTIANFPALVKQNTGADLYGISPTNEPDFASCGNASPCNGSYPSMLFTRTELVSFVKAVGPKLHNLNPPVKLLTPEPREWLHLWSNNSAAGSTDPLAGSYDFGHALYADTTAWGLLDVVATHQYETQVAEPWPVSLPNTKPTWMTEMSGIKWWPEEGPTSTIDNGIVVAGWIHDALVNGGASAWFWWWYQALNTDDNEGLLLKSGAITKRYYTLGNFSKFVRPGYTRIAVNGTAPTGVLLSAYHAPDGTVVIVAINQGSASVSVPISVTGGTPPSSLKPYVTSSSDNLALGNPLNLSGGSFTATLASKTVTTFVGK